MKRRRIVYILIVSIIVLIVGGVLLNKLFFSVRGYVPENGVVPDESTAIKVAEAVWLPIYGEGIYSKQPFVAEYNEKEGCWIVNGTLPKNLCGGVPEIKIKKSNGEVIYINHSK